VQPVVEEGVVFKKLICEMDDVDCIEMVHVVNQLVIREGIEVQAKQ
jgi:hypothetical protein